MSRLWKFTGRRRDEIAMVDTTGGTIEAIKLEDNRVPKVLLRLVKNGVAVEMALPVLHALDFRDEFAEALKWAQEDGS